MRVMKEGVEALGAVYGTEFEYGPSATVSRKKRKNIKNKKKNLIRQTVRIDYDKFCKHCSFESFLYFTFR